eukprot:4241905-Amphidinium_carterae.1
MGGKFAGRCWQRQQLKLSGSRLVKQVVTAEVEVVGERAVLVWRGENLPDLVLRTWVLGRRLRLTAWLQEAGLIGRERGVVDGAMGAESYG